MNLESVLGQSLRHCGIKRNVHFTNRTGSTMNVNFEVTDTKRATLFVHKGCGNGSMIVFTPDGKCKIVNDTKCIDQVKQNMASTPGFDIVHDRGACVLDVDALMESMSMMKGQNSRATLESAFPDTQRVLGTSLERQSREATHCPFRAWCEICVKAKSPDGKHAIQVVNPEHIPLIEFGYAFATDTPGGPKISMMVATDSIHGSIFCCGKEKRWPG